MYILLPHFIKSFNNLGMRKDCLPARSTIFPMGWLVTLREDLFLDCCQFQKSYKVQNKNTVHERRAGCARKREWHTFLSLQYSA